MTTFPTNGPMPWYRWYEPRRSALAATIAHGRQASSRSRSMRYPTATTSSSSAFCNAARISTGTVHHAAFSAEAWMSTVIPRARPTP